MLIKSAPNYLKNFIINFFFMKLQGNVKENSKIIIQNVNLFFIITVLHTRNWSVKKKGMIFTKEFRI